MSKRGKGEPLGTLNAENPGICNNVRTVPGSRQCGIAKYLMLACFLDNCIIGSKGLKPHESNDFRDQVLKDVAKENCDTMVYVACKPKEGIPPKACVAYLEAAKEAEFHIVFTGPKIISNNKKPIYKIMEVTDAIDMIDAEDEHEDEADKTEGRVFIKDNGAHWFFCKCKRNKEEECLQMVTNTPIEYTKYKKYK